MSDRLGANAVPTQDAERLAALFDMHVDQLYRVARRLVPNADDALDLVQETFLKAARSVKTIPQGAENEQAWLVRVLINIRRDQWRKDAVRRRYEPVLHRPGRLDDPEVAFVIQATVWSALDYLSPRRRAVVVMAEIDGLSIASISSLLGISPITVRWHLSRGRHQLAKRLRISSGAINDAHESLAGHRPAPSRTSLP